MTIKSESQTTCNHCWHSRRGPIHMVVPDGHVVEECCRCHAHRTVHIDHALGSK